MTVTDDMVVYLGNLAVCRCVLCVYFSQAFSSSTNVFIIGSNKFSNVLHLLVHTGFQESLS